MPARSRHYLQWHIENAADRYRNGPELADLVRLLGEHCKTLKEMAETFRYLL
ncbi:hypothetical protein ACNKHW_15205 [Shigella flexneri]